MVFARASFFSHRGPARTTKHRKKQFRTLQIVPGHPKIRPGAIQNAQKKTNVSKKRFANAHEASKSEKKTPKSEK